MMTAVEVNNKKGEERWFIPGILDICVVKSKMLEIASTLGQEQIRLIHKLGPETIEETRCPVCKSPGGKCASCVEEIKLITKEDGDESA